MTTHEEQQDRARDQLFRVWNYLRNHTWVRVPEMAEALGISQTGAASRIRDLRKAKYGGHIVLRRFLGHGIYEFSLGSGAVVPESKDPEVGWDRPAWEDDLERDRARWED